MLGVSARVLTDIDAQGRHSERCSSAYKNPAGYLGCLSYTTARIIPLLRLVHDIENLQQVSVSAHYCGSGVMLKKGTLSVAITWVRLDLRLHVLSPLSRRCFPQVLLSDEFTMFLYSSWLGSCRLCCTSTSHSKRHFPWTALSAFDFNKIDNMPHDSLNPSHALWQSTAGSGSLYLVGISWATGS